MASLICRPALMQQQQQQYMKVSVLVRRTVASTSTTNTTTGDSRDARRKTYAYLRSKNYKMLDPMLRVDHAGEFGADRIYAGQHYILRNTEVGPIIKHMWEQEKHHLATFELLMVQHRVRPTLLKPFWNIAGFALGAGTALLGKEAAMACTVAVETVIGGHYDDQLRDILIDGDGSSEQRNLMQTIKTFRDEELEHLDTGLRHDAELAPQYRLLSNAIMTGCRAAIWLSERI